MSEPTKYWIEDYVFVQPGQPFRLFPFGKLTRGGKVREITRELAEKIKLPHFRPPIKLGSHAEETRAGGHIVALEVRDDGLYAVPEYTEEGLAALERGDYRYHSPEVIWEGELENPLTGVPIAGPLILGDALLHTPALGEAAALYSVEVVEGDGTMTVQDDKVSVGVLEQIINMFRAEPLPEPQPEPQAPEPVTLEPVETFEAEYQQAKAERDAFEVELAELKAAGLRANRIDSFKMELGEHVAADVYELLADLPDEQAQPLVEAFKALANQADAAGLETDAGNSGANVTGDPQAALDAAVRAVQQERNLSYPEAFAVIQKEQPEVFGAWIGE